MTGIAAFTPAAFLPDAQSGLAQPLATGISFEEALRAAEQASERSFGFNELGLFGRGAAGLQPAPEGLPTAERGPETAGGPSEFSGARGGGDAPQPQIARQAPPRARIADRRADADRPAMPPAVAEAGGAPACPVPAESRPAAPEVDQPAVRAVVPMRRTAASLARPPVRLAVMIEDGRVSLVGRDFSLTEEDRARLEERLGEILESFGLGLRELVLNGMPGAAAPFTRKDG